MHVFVYNVHQNPLLLVHYFISRWRKKLDLSHLKSKILILIEQLH